MAPADRRRALSDAPAPPAQAKSRPGATGSA